MGTGGRGCTLGDQLRGWSGSSGQSNDLGQGLGFSAGWKRVDGVEMCSGGESLVLNWQRWGRKIEASS